MAEDVFAGGADVGAEQDDPFAGTDFGDFPPEPQGDEAAQEAMAAGLKPTEDKPPIVDREGNKVEPDPTPAAPAESAGQTEDPTPAAEGGTTGSTTEDPTSASTPAPASSDQEQAAGSNAGQPSSAEAASAPEPEPEEAPEPAPEPAEEPAAPAAEESAPPAAPESAEEPAQTDGSSSEQGAEGDETDEEDGHDTPTELKDASDRVTHRAYAVLRLTGPGKYEQVVFHVNAENKIVPKGTEGARKNKMLLARSADDALVAGYKVCGAPPEGITLVAVPHSHFRLKPVKPKPPEPSKTRLQIG